MNAFFYSILYLLGSMVKQTKKAHLHKEKEQRKIGNEKGTKIENEKGTKIKNKKGTKKDQEKDRNKERSRLRKRDKEMV